jgi:hypothetical protein
MGLGFGLVALLLPRDSMHSHNLNLTTTRRRFMIVIHNVSVPSIDEAVINGFLLYSREMRATRVVCSVSCVLRYGSLQLDHSPEQCIGRLK